MNFIVVSTGFALPLHIKATCVSAGAAACAILLLRSRSIYQTLVFSGVERRKGFIVQVLPLLDSVQEGFPEITLRQALISLAECEDWQEKQLSWIFPKKKEKKYVSVRLSNQHAARHL